MSKRLEGKVAVITGGGGVGQAIVEKFVREGRRSRSSISARPIST